MSSLHLALALGGDLPESSATWAHLAREAEVGLLDFVTLDTASPTGHDAEAGTALDPVQVATRLASTTQAIGLLPTVHAGLSDPWSIAGAVESLDEVSGGRAGVHLRVPVPADENGWVRAVRRGWSPSTSSAGGTTGTRGAAPPVVALPGRVGRGPRALPADAADIGFVTPRTTVDAQQLVAAARTAGAPRHLLGELVVVLDDDAARARGRWQRTGGRAPSTAPEHTRVFAGTPAQLADLALGWRTAGICGLRLHPVDPDRDLRAITRGLAPELQRRGAFRRSYAGTDLRERLAGSALVARSADHCTAA